MNLERKFEKELAGDLRKSTAEKLLEIRKRPHTFKDLQNEEALPAEYERGYIKKSIEETRSGILGRIFKTEKFRKKETLLNNLLQLEKERSITDIQEDYQGKFNEILKNCPLTQEEKNQYLSTEAMEKMNLEDYLTLLKRLSGEAFFHVTRYGVRENTFTSTGGGHTVGEGDFVNSLEPLLQDGNIKDCTTTVLSNKEYARSLVEEEFIQKEKEDGKSIEEIVSKIMQNYSSTYFLDRESSHFSYGKDLHGMYGGEDNYKFYFYYPVEYILQNDFYHSTRETQITIGQGYYHNQGGIDQQYNDFEIFNFGEGVPINGGILCITGDLRVDPETGSQYVLENGKPKNNDAGGFIRPEKSISSREYWEKYFKENPELKPSKIMYSNLSTSARSGINSDLVDWAQSKNARSQSKEKKQEFSDYQQNTINLLRETFTKLVEEKYSETESK